MHEIIITYVIRTDSFDMTMCFRYQPQAFCHKLEVCYLLLNTGCTAGPLSYFQYQKNF